MRVKAIDHVRGDKHLPEFMKDFHDTKDLFKTIWGWWGDKIEGSDYPVTWVAAQVFTVDYFLWFMGLHGYKLQKDRTKDVDFYKIEESIKEEVERRRGSFTKILKETMQNEKP